MTAQVLPRETMELSRLTQLEWEILEAETRQTLDYIAVNDLGRVVGCDHVVAWRRGHGVTAITGGISVEQYAPQVSWFDRLARHIANEENSDMVTAIDRSALPAAIADGFAKWISGSLAWCPLSGRPSSVTGRRELIGGLFLLRGSPFASGELRIAGRIGRILGYAHTVLVARHVAPVGWRARLGGLRRALIPAAIVAAGFVPVPLSVLCNATVVPIDPVVIAAPLNGVIDEIVSAPNSVVSRGDLLVRLEDGELEAEHAVAVRRVGVLAAELTRLEQKSFLDEEARSQLALARSRMLEASAELATVESRLGRTQVRAPADGVAIVDGRDKWRGRPVNIGERIMLLADPAAVRLEVIVPVADAAVVGKGASVKFFLAVAPDRPLEALLDSVSFRATMQPDQTTGYVGQARFTGGIPLPRLGLTGTAKIIGPDVPLYYALFRKPVAAIRRLTGL